MKEINVEFPPEKTITINGEVFGVKLSDVETLELASELASEYNEISGEGAKPRTVLETIKRSLTVLDKLLGDGATSRLLAGRSVDASFMLGSVILPVFSAVLEAAGEDYARRLAEDYE